MTGTGDNPSQASSDGTNVRKPRVRLHFLDGLRGLACLYVLVFHEATVKITGRGEPAAVGRIFIPNMNRGRIGVVFFIVLSGFSLMLPIARSGSLVLVGGFRDYIRRRARRIMPPYYAALFFSIALIVLYNRTAARSGAGAPIEAALKPGSIISHLLLVHNLTFEWAYRINGPMWSVATEWQIYFLLPAVLLPLWRRFGGGVAVAFAWIAGAAPFFLLPADANFFWACPWFLGSFALGMAGAVIGFAPAMATSALQRVPWAVAALALLVGVLALYESGRADGLPYPVVDFCVSLLALAILCACVQEVSRGGGLLSDVLGAGPVAYLGGFSYSLYLVQHPVLRFVEKGLSKLPWSYDRDLAIAFIVGTPVVMAVAWLFAEFFEKPFTGGAVLLPALQRLWRGAERSPLSRRDEAR